MTLSITIGTAHARPGTIVYGEFEAVRLPTGGADVFPVIIAQGHNPNGPVLWLTANIHGAEYNGIAVIHNLVVPELIAELTGTVIAVPTLSPAGLRTGERSPYYVQGKDPNRLFPDLTEREQQRQSASPSALEQAYARLFEQIQATADYLIDLHDYGIRSIPFVLRDPVFYQEGRDRANAVRLQRTIGEMLDAFGLTVINEYASEKYVEMSLHRSVSGAALNHARIPAVTVEIGGFRQVNAAHVRAVVAGIRNVMRWAGMLPGPAEPLPPVPILKPGFAIRRATHPRVPQACLVHHLVQPGDEVQVGDPVARMVDIYGRPVGPDQGLLRSEYHGFVIGIFSGIAFYPNEAILGLAIRDTNQLVIPIAAP